MTKQHDILGHLSYEKVIGAQIVVHHRWMRGLDLAVVNAEMIRIAAGFDLV
ncbi:hypothetical protein [Actinomadura sp. 9N407]|uniref:hypothetical protein n=1 Tax=Actinomadura sp. 9N407 TaxID=3375154 RepID=UPI0037B36765